MANLTEIYELYGNQVYRYLISLTGNPQVAEEITQETFYRAVLHINKFEGKCSMFTWLCQIGKHIYFNQRKKEKKYETASMKEMEEKSGDTLEQVLIDKEQVLIIHSILHSMEEPYKEVFSLRIFGELKFKEIGQIFGRTENWAKVTYYRAKERILKELEERV